MNSNLKKQPNTFGISSHEWIDTSLDEYDEYDEDDFPELVSEADEKRKNASKGLRPY